MKKTAIILGGILLVLIIGSALYFKHTFPYGHRVCCLPCMLMSLTNYADEHSGWYPKDGANPIESLRLAIPDGHDMDPLAGITGDRKILRQRLATNGVLDEGISSWKYIPGLRVDDGRGVALLWETESGITFNGQRAEAGSHAVGFADGHWEQISASDWKTFLDNQMTLIDSIRAKREEILISTEQGSEGTSPR